MGWKEFIRDYFTFDRTNRRGIVALVIIVLVIAFLPCTYKWIVKDEPPDFSKLDSIVAQQETKATKKPFVLELNEADTSALIRLPAIGAVLAERIVKYRDKLGGFYSVEQLKEVYGITEETLDIISEKLSVDTSLIKKIMINNVSLTALQQHPYFYNGIAEDVIKFRSKHGAIKSIGDLQQIPSIDSAQLQRILPYIRF